MGFTLAKRSLSKPGHSFTNGEDCTFTLPLLCDQEREQSWVKVLRLFNAVIEKVLRDYKR
jgi:hypothetical protein